MSDVYLLDFLAGLYIISQGSIIAESLMFDC